MKAENNVKVAVRIRPQLPKEKIEMCSVCTSVTPNEPQVWLGKDKAFTFDHMFDQASKQEPIYEACVRQLVEGCLEGYNATVLAYGQTGSGKTHTMGTGFDIEGKPADKGIIPRAMEHLFNAIQDRQAKAKENGLPMPEFKVNTQFLELYNEEIIDLLADERTQRSAIKVHEDATGGIYTVGATTRPVHSTEHTLNCLKKGALSRTTASTQMNSSSSRSHAIFTIHIKQQRVVAIRTEETNGHDENTDQVSGDGSDDVPTNGIQEMQQEFETLTAKFHFVDLAGSERLKRTGATGERQREGISINSGLLALGNVISALGDKAARASHVPYRDSKLTRLLQDSLGGNSRTLMIACISPSDRDFMETLNTLRYANRAKNIKNRVVANQDKSSQTIMVLRREIQQLQLELMEYKQGKRLIAEDGSEVINDMYYENTMLQSEINSLKTRIKALQETHERLVVRNSELILEKEAGKWMTGSDGTWKTDSSAIKDVVGGYIREIEELRTKLIETEEMCSQLRKQVQRNHGTKFHLSPHSTTAVAISGNYDVGFEEPQVDPIADVLEEAKRNVKKAKRQLSMCNGGGKAANDDNGNEVPSEMAEIAQENGTAEAIDGSDDDSEEDEIEEESRENEIELVELTSEIDIKEKLIVELEKSQKKMNTMKHHYEEKLVMLQAKISEIESERDQVLSKLSSGLQPNEQTKKIRGDYEKKLSSLQAEMKKMQSAKKEHLQAMRNQVQYESQLRHLKNDVSEMKKQKVRLLSRMKEEATKHRQLELKNNKRIAQLTKQERVKDFRIRSLEVERKKAQLMLKRRDDEVIALKKRIKPMSDRVAGRNGSARSGVNGRQAKKLPQIFSPKNAKKKWSILEKNIDKFILSKKSTQIHEKQMDRCMRQREQLSHALDKKVRKLDAVLKSSLPDDSAINILYEEIDSLEANIEYLNQNIADCQSTIMQLEDGKEDTNIALDVPALLEQTEADDIKYLFEKILTMAINQSLLASQQEEETREYELKYKQSIDSSLIQEQLLHHVLEQSFIETDLVADEVSPPDSSTCSTSTYHVDPVDIASGPIHQAIQRQLSESKATKTRRLTKTPQELLYETSTAMTGEDLPKKESDALMSRSLWNPVMMSSNEAGNLQRVSSSPSLNKEMKPRAETRDTFSPSLRRKPLAESRRLNKTTIFPAANLPPLPPLPKPFELCDTTPPCSPPVSRRSRLPTENNVFSRLTSGTQATISNHPDRGVINPVATGRYDKQASASLICSHIAEGHSRAVLSVVATNDVMFTGSKDCTAKIWDLHTGREIQSLNDHPDAVTVVRYNEYRRLAFSVSKSYIKVWDPRDNSARCIKVLSSSGLACSALSSSMSTRGPDLAPGETKIFDIRLNPYGTSLYSTCGPIVRIWDLRMFHCVGKLNTGHQAGVMTIAADEAGMDNNMVITGSKDHYVKVFDIMEGIGGIYNAKLTLEPPHCDGIESLVINGDCLFSASRDKCIKKWDLTLPKEKLVYSIANAHRNWIYSLAYSATNGTLVSACRSGVIKLWSAETCAPLSAEIQAHRNSIHSLDVNNSLLFTASADNTVGLWKWKSNDCEF